MRFLECLQSTGKILHGNNYLWSMVKKSSVSRTQRFTYFQILCYAWKGESEPNLKYCLGTTVGLVQRFITIQNFGQSTENRWNSSGIFSQDSPHCSLSVKSKCSLANWANPNNSKDELSSSRCSMTSFGEIQTMKRNVLLIPHLCLYSQKDFQQDIGHFSDRIRNKVVFHLQRKTRRRMGQSR